MDERKIEGVMRGGPKDEQPTAAKKEERTKQSSSATMPSDQMSASGETSGANASSRNASSN